VLRCVLQCDAVGSTVLQCLEVCATCLRACAAYNLCVRSSVLQCDAVCVAVCRIVLHCDEFVFYSDALCCSTLKSWLPSCELLQRISYACNAVCCSAMQCVAV